MYLIDCDIIPDGVHLKIQKTYGAVQQKLAMGGRLHLVELWDVVDDREEDDGHDVEETVENLSEFEKEIF